VIKRKYKIEKLIASQSILSLKQFQAKWNLVLNNNPIFFVTESVLLVCFILLIMLINIYMYIHDNSKPVL